MCDVLPDLNIIIQCAFAFLVYFIKVAKTEFYSNQPTTKNYLGLFIPACAIIITISIAVPLRLRHIAIAKTQHSARLLAFHFMRSESKMVLHHIQAPWFWHESKWVATKVSVLDVVGVEFHGNRIF